MFEIKDNNKRATTDPIYLLGTLETPAKQLQTRKNNAQNSRAVTVQFLIKL